MISRTSHWRLLIAIATCAASPASAQAPLAIHIHPAGRRFRRAGALKSFWSSFIRLRFATRSRLNCAVIGKTTGNPHV